MLEHIIIETYLNQIWAFFGFGWAGLKAQKVKSITNCMIRQFTKIVFLAKNYAPVSSISNQFSTLKNRIKEKYVIQKFEKLPISAHF